MAGPRTAGPLIVALLIVGLLGLLVGCSSSARPAATPTRTLAIVAAEDVWGSIVAQLAGPAAHVTSIVSDPNADPHSHEATTDDARAFADAAYVIVNGAGYDSWASKLLTGNPSSARRVLNVADLLGKKAGDNPHFWYSPDFVARVTDRVEADLKALDPARTADFDTRRAVLDSASVPYRNRLAAIRASFTDTPVASTESIFVYLADALGLRIISPPAFMDAVAEGTDPPAPAVAEFQDQLAKKQAKILVYNLQTSTAVTDNLRRQAATAGIPTVGITETLQPSSATTYEQWFDNELVAIQHALS